MTMPDYAGLRQYRKARSTGTHVGVYDGVEAGMDTDGGRWQTVCEEHGAICSHETLTLARNHASAPEGWCEACEGNGNFDIKETLEEARKRYVALQAKPLTDLEVHAQVIRDLNTTEKLIRDLEQRIKDGDTTVECDECDGAGSVTPDDPTEEQLDEWRSEVESAVSVIDECPV